MQQIIIDTFHSTARTAREAIFDDQRLTPRSAPNNAATAAPGWVGRDWQAGGTLLMAINPGGGGDQYRVNPTDERLYAFIRGFRDAEGEARGRALRLLSEAWIEIQATHNIRRVTDAVFEATGATTQSSAFLNVLPFRTRDDKPARAGELRRAWRIATGPQVAALAPRRIVALGCKAYDALLAAGVGQSHEIVLIKRAIGDSSIPLHARETLARLREAA